MKALRTVLIFLGLVVSALTLSVVPAVALEAGGLKATNYEFSVRPEFDTPEVLAIHNVTLTNTSDTPFQGRIGFQLPKGVQLQMVCEIGQGGGHACQPFKSEDKGDFVEVTWNATRPIVNGDRFPIYVEYYYNPFTSKTPRKFPLPFRSAYPIDSLYVVLTQPKGSSEWKVDRQANLNRPVQDGTTDWQYNFTNQPAGLLAFNVSYVKPDDRPSVERPKDANGKPPAQAGGPPSSPGSRTPPWLTAVLGVVLVAIVGCFVLIVRGAPGQRS